MLGVTKVLNVNYTWNSKEREMPLIKVSGIWLYNLGFKSGETCLVEGEDGKLTLSLIKDEGFSLSLMDCNNYRRGF